jgi:outer membrane biosynthesis protein TonB
MWAARVETLGVIVLLGLGCGPSGPAPVGAEADPAPGASSEIHGALEHEAIRKVVRKHIDEVRSCYSTALTPCPNLNGRVAVEFVIEASGEVGESKLREATTTDKTAKCIVEAVKGWRFPRPSDGKPVTVIYPFNLSPG